MAITLTISQNRKFSIKEDGLRGVAKGRCTIVPTGTYATGGAAIDEDDVDVLGGIGGITLVGSNTAAALYTLSYDRQAKKLLFHTAGAEVANTTDLGALSLEFYVEYYGS